MVAKTDRDAIKAAYEAVAEHGSVMVAAKAKGLPYETMRNRYQRAMQLYNKPDIRSSVRSLARATRQSVALSERSAADRQDSLHP